MSERAPSIRRMNIKAKMRPSRQRSDKGRRYHTPACAIEKQRQTALNVSGERANVKGWGGGA